MIPVLIAPAYNRHDLLARMLKSIDHRVDRLLILDNGKTGLRLPGDPVVAIRTAVFAPPFISIGYGGSINFGILQTPDAPWWMWVSNDVAFHPGHLATVVERMNAATEPTIITGGFTWGAVNHGCIEKAGLVDEHDFYPIYFDDNDYHRRCDLAGVTWVEDWATGSTHGDDLIKASATIRSDQAAMAGNHRSFPESHRRYLAKWGGEPGKEVFTTPWDSGLPVWVTRPDPAGRARRLW